MKFFFDNCIPLGLVKALRELVRNEDHEIVALRERFSPSTPDDEWIPAIAREGGWVLVTHDIGIARSRHEREVWRKAGLSTFFFAKGLANQRPIKQMEALARHWDEVVKIGTKMRPGASYVINVRGKPKRRDKKKRRPPSLSRTRTASTESLAASERFLSGRSERKRMSLYGAVRAVSVDWRSRNRPDGWEEARQASSRRCAHGSPSGQPLGCRTASRDP